jgi:lysozyme
VKALDIAVKLIAKFEGCRLQAYKDIVGIPTIGYGETKGVKMGDVWTQAKADAELRSRTQEFLEGVLKAAPKLAAFTSNQQAACTSLAYNIGLGAFAGSTVAKRIATGDRAGAADAFLLWNKAGGQVVQGLVTRRQEERRVFMSPE